MKLLSDPALTEVRSTFDSLREQLRGLEERIAENFKNFATGATTDKLSGAVLVVFGLALNNISGWLPR